MAIARGTAHHWSRATSTATNGSITMLNTWGRTDQIVVEAEHASANSRIRMSSGPRICCQTMTQAATVSAAQNAVRSGNPPSEKSR